MAGKHVANFCPACGAPTQPAMRHGRRRPVCTACGYVIYQDPKVAVIGLVQQDGKLLLAQRDVNPGKGLWSLPGGFVELGEHPQVALIRELQEETGLQIRVDCLLDVFYSYIRCFSHVVTIAYGATVVGGQLVAGDDVIRVAWFSKEQLPELVFSSTQTLVQRWVKGDI